MRKNIGCAMAMLCVLEMTSGRAAAKNYIAPGSFKSYTPVIVAQSSQATKPNTERTIGVCHPVENRLESRLSAVNGVAPVAEAMTYIEEISKQKFNNSGYVSVYKAAKMTLLQAPKHGELLLDSDSGAYFSSDYTYEGLDSATVLVEVGGYKVTVIYRFVLMKNVPGSSDQGSATDNKNICPNGYRWKISTTPDANGNLIVSSVEYVAPDAGTSVIDTAASATALSSAVLNKLTNASFPDYEF